jgi:hypothetical protein
MTPEEYKEKRREIYRRYRAKHRKELLAKQKEYYKRKREKYLIQKREYRARMKNNPKYRLRIVWYNMIARCYNPRVLKFKDYGKRGISICAEWRNNFDAFYAWALVSGYDISLQIDRIDNDGDYTPDNCRFVTRRENVTNRQRKGKYGTGVYKAKSGFCAKIRFNGKGLYLGMFSTPEVAQQAYQNKLRQLQGDNHNGTHTQDLYGNTG